MKTLARIGAIAFAGIAVTLAAVGLRDDPQGTAEVTAPAFVPPEKTSLRSALLRCQALGQAGAGDPGCLRVWAENRRRFLGLAGRQEASRPGPAVAVGTERSPGLTPAPTPDAVAAR